MGIGYQRTDRKIIDYKLWYLENIPSAIRGPRRWTGSKPYFTFLGAAQTFGRFVTTPYPELLSGWAQNEYLNFGFAGAGPEFFLKNKSIIKLVNESKLCFLQIMSGRSVSTKLLSVVGKGGTLKFNSGTLEGQSMLALNAYRELIKAYTTEEVIEQVAETRRQWINAYERLLEAIIVPVVLVRISSAPLSQFDDFSNANKLFGTFPQLINEECIRHLIPHAVLTIDCVYLSEAPQILLNYTTRQPEEVFSADVFPDRPEWSRCYNSYYPSPSMHMFVADKIRQEAEAYM